VHQLNAAEAAEALMPVLRAVSGWCEAAAKNGISPAEIKAMASAFDTTKLEHAAELVSKHEAAKGAKSRVERRGRFPELFDTHHPYGLQPGARAGGAPAARFQFIAIDLLSRFSPGWIRSRPGKLPRSEVQDDPWHSAEDADDHQHELNFPRRMGDQTRSRSRW
jgi:hypothetical protein